MPQRIMPARRDVPFLTERRIEEEALLLLAEYGRDQCEVAGPPIPIGKFSITP